MNVKFLLRGLLLALPVAVAATAVAVVALRVRAQIGPPPDPTPPPPTIRASRDEPPQGTVAFQEWVRHRGQSYAMVGCGFLMEAEDGETVGVTTAHSVGAFDDPGRPIDRIKLQTVGGTGISLEFDTLHGPPGHPRTGADMTVDYVFLHADRPIDAAYVLRPDARGAPQPGERVSLYKCTGEDSGGQRIIQGTVQSVDGASAWVLMDEAFSPAMWSGSGSPFISQHTGRVVGMLIAGTLRSRWVLLGMHPVGSLAQRIETATEYPKMAEYAIGSPTAKATTTLSPTAIASPPPTATKALTLPGPTVWMPLDVWLSTDADQYPSSGDGALDLTLTNQSQEPVYLPVCGPWEVVTPDDPDRPVWGVECEIDYLGHQVKPGGVFTDRLSVQLPPGSYGVQTRVYSDCELGEPKEISATETYYGEFGACAHGQEVGSPMFAVSAE
jgi:hypothetical protein